MANNSKAKGRKGKLGKNKHRIPVYYQGRYYWNKARRAAKHLRRYGEDKTSRSALTAALAAMPLHLQRSFEKMYSGALSKVA